jgi:hypothetical protein
MNVLAVAPAQRGEALRQDRSRHLPEGIVGGIAREHAEAAHPADLLRPSGKRPRGSSGGEADKFSSLH